MALLNAVDLGFDVWTNAYRGSKYNQKHLTLDQYENPEQYWNYSMNEQADYDMPAAVDYVYKQNDEKKIYVLNSA